MTNAVAWIVPLPGNVWIAVGNLELVHVLPDMPARSVIADAPAFLNEAISWDGSTIPVFDAGRFNRGIEKISETVYYGVLRYRPTPSGPQQFGAMKMTAIPQRVAVDDQMACDLPESHHHWRPYSVSCFTLDGRAVPVLDLARLFSQTRLTSNSDPEPSGADDSGTAASGQNGSDPAGYTDSLATT
jgi:hypothetical protein